MPGNREHRLTNHREAGRAACLVLASLLLALPGCGGGGGANEGSGSGTSNYTPPATQEPLEFPLVSLFECDSPPAEPTTQEHTVPVGAFVGSLFDCTLGVEVNVSVLVAEDGRFAIVRYAGDDPQGQPLTGVLTKQGDTFRGSGTDFAATGAGSENSGLLSIDGLFSDGRRLDGRWRVEGEGYGYFALAYLVDYLVSPHAEVTLADELLNTTSRTVHGLNQYGEETSWSIQTDGSFTGHDTLGCDYAGQFSLSGPHSPVLHVEVSLAGCARAGAYTGLAIRWPSKGIGEEIDVVVDDGGGQALVLQLPF